jgi:hypothetical protein
MALNRARPSTKKTLKSPAKMQENQGFMSGETGIRTLGTLAGTPVFKTGAIGRSAISPGRMLWRSVGHVNDDTSSSDTKSADWFEVEKNQAARRCGSGAAVGNASVD